MHFPIKIVNYVIGAISSYKQNMKEFGKEIIKVQSKNKWGYSYVIPLFPLVGVNDNLEIFNLSKTFVYIDRTEKLMNQFSIGYMNNPTLNVNKVCIEKLTHA